MPSFHPKKLLLIGPPGCGKTTVLRRVVERLSGLRLAGFYTREIRQRGQRAGFEAVGLGVSLSNRDDLPALLAERLLPGR